MSDTPQIAVIHWIDAALYGSGSFNRADKFGLVKGYAAGLLIAEDDEKITLAMDWFYESNTVRNISTYPKSGIKKITRHTLIEREPCQSTA